MTPALRKRKLRIFIDDDGLADGDMHHYQLTRAFLSIGAKCLLGDEEFGEPGELCHFLDAEIAHFVRLTPKLYARSLGAWCAIEMLSVDWMRALAEAIAVHFPHFKHEPYFEDCFAQQVEERHAAEALDGVWTHLDRIVQSAEARPHRLQPGDHLFVEPAHLDECDVGIRGLEVDTDGADAERA
jgi:hypothetical protein